MGLRGRLALFFLVITVVPLGAGAFALQLQIDAEVRERAAAELERTGAIAAAVATAAHVRAGDLATDLARRGLGDVLADGDPAAAAAWLDRQELDERADVAVLAGADGALLATRVVAGPPPALRGGIDAVAPAVPHGPAPQGALLAVREVRGGDPPRLLGHIAAAVWLDETLLSRVTPQLPAGTGAAFVAAGQVLAAAGAPAGAVPVEDLPQESGVVPTVVDGQAVLAGTTALHAAGGGGSLVLWVPTPARAFPMEALALLGATLLAAVGLVWLLAGAVVAPLRRAADFAREVAHGEVSRRLQPSGGRELADLADALNTMSAELLVDPLTQLWNRRFFDLAVQRELQRADRSRAGVPVPVSLLAVDLDDFKSVNDDYGGGHAAGDAVLMEVGRRLRAVTRAPDVVARPGGDEFVVLLPDTDYDGALAAAERIRAALADAPMSLVGVPGTRVGELAVTCSVGVATRPRHGRDARSLSKAADQALLRLAKRAGGNAVRGADELEPA